MTHSRRPKSPIICRCNNVSRAEIEKAIREGCDTLNKIFDATSAGVGPCGGSCRRKLAPLLEHFLKTGAFPETLVEDRTGKVEKTSSQTGVCEGTSKVASESTSSHPSEECQTPCGACLKKISGDNQ